jgi:hypothetical protein
MSSTSLEIIPRPVSTVSTLYFKRKIISPARLHSVVGYSKYTCSRDKTSFIVITNLNVGNKRGFLATGLLAAADA